MMIDSRAYITPPDYTGLGITDCVVKVSGSPAIVPASGHEVPKSSEQDIIIECLINDKIDMNGGIMVVFPNTFSDYATACQMLSSYVGDYTCVNEGNSYKISITDEMASGTTIMI